MIKKKAAKRKLYSSKPARYELVKTFFDSGEIKSLTDIFNYVPPSDIAGLLKINHGDIQKKFANSESLSVKHIMILSKLFKIKPADMFYLAAGLKPIK